MCCDTMAYVQGVLFLRRGRHENVLGVRGRWRGLEIRDEVGRDGLDNGTIQ